MLLRTTEDNSFPYFFKGTERGEGGKINTKKDYIYSYIEFSLIMPVL